MDNVSLNRRFLEADGNDEEKECTLLFNTYHKVVFETIDKMMRNHPDPAVDADDLTNETFIQAFKKRDEIREPEKLLGRFGIGSRIALQRSKTELKKVCVTFLR